MPVDTRQVGKSYTSQNYYGVLRTSEGVRTPFGLTADLTKFTKNAYGNIEIPSGYFWQRLGSGLGRVLPIVRATAATATSARVLTVQCAAIFAVGEVLVTYTGANAIGTIESIDVEANTITLAANTVTAVAIGDYLMVSGTTIAKPTTNGGAGTIGFNTSIIDIADDGEVACCVAASVYGARMPQSIAALLALFPGIVAD